VSVTLCFNITAIKCALNQILF